MAKRRLGLPYTIAAVAVTALLAACGGGSNGTPPPPAAPADNGGGTPATPPAPAPSPTPTPPPTTKLLLQVGYGIVQAAAPVDGTTTLFMVDSSGNNTKVIEESMLDNAVVTVTKDNRIIYRRGDGTYSINLQGDDKQMLSAKAANLYDSFELPSGTMRLVLQNDEFIGVDSNGANKVSLLHPDCNFLTHYVGRAPQGSLVYDCDHIYNFNGVNSNFRDIYAVNQDGTGNHVISAGPYEKFAGNFLPGDHLVIGENHFDTNEMDIFSYAMDGSSSIPLINYAQWDRGDATPDGHILFYGPVDTALTDKTAYTINWDGGNRVKFGAGKGERFVTIAPDYVSTPQVITTTDKVVIATPPSYSSNWSLNIYNADGSGGVPLGSGRLLSGFSNSTEDLGFDVTTEPPIKHVAPGIFSYRRGDWAEQSMQLCLVDTNTGYTTSWSTSGVGNKTYVSLTHPGIAGQDHLIYYVDTLVTNFTVRRLATVDKNGVMANLSDISDNQAFDKFIALTDDNRVVYAHAGLNQPGTYLVNVDGSSRTQIMNWSGTPLVLGARIVFQTSKSNASIKSILTDGSGEVELTAANETGAIVAKVDESRIIYKSNADGNLYIVTADGTGRASLTSGVPAGFNIVNFLGVAVPAQSTPAAASLAVTFPGPSGVCSQLGPIDSPPPPPDPIPTVTPGPDVWEFGSTGTAGPEVARGIATDNNGKVLLVGNTSGDIDGLGTGTYKGGIDDVWVAQYDADGSRNWIRQFGTTGDDAGTGIAVDNNNNVYITGWTLLDITPNASGAGPNGAAADAFVAKYNSSGDLQWLKQFGTTSADFATAITVDGSGNTYVAGYTMGDFGGGSSTINGDTDGFIAKYDSSGVQQWIKQLASNGNDQINGVTLDNGGNVYVAGFTSADLDGSGAGTLKGGNDIFAAKYNSSGTLQWIKQFGTAADDTAQAIKSDGTNVYLSGITKGDLDGSGSQQYAGGEDLFTLRIDSSGTAQWLSQLGTAGDDRAYGVCTDSYGNVYVGGVTYGNLDGATSSASGVNGDLVTYKLSPNGTLQWLRQIGTNSKDGATSIATNKFGSVYAAGDSFADLDGNGPGQYTSSFNDVVVVRYGVTQ